MNYNNFLCNYCVSSTGNSNFNVRIIKSSHQNISNTSRLLQGKTETKANTSKEQKVKNK